MYPWLCFGSIYKYSKVILTRVNGHWPILLMHRTKVISSSRTITLGFPGRSKGISWGISARSCGGLLGDLIGKRRSAQHFFEGREGVDVILLMSHHPGFS